MTHRKLIAISRDGEQKSGDHAQSIDCHGCHGCVFDAHGAAAGSCNLPDETECTLTHDRVYTPSALHHRVPAPIFHCMEEP